jgi:hypothetical protein
MTDDPNHLVQINAAPPGGAQPQAPVPTTSTKPTLSRYRAALAVALLTFLAAAALQTALNQPVEDPDRFAYHPYPGDRTSRAQFDLAMRERWEAQETEAMMFGRNQPPKPGRSTASVVVVSLLVAGIAGGAWRR